jgi:hypothetical protein
MRGRVACICRARVPRIASGAVRNMATMIQLNKVQGKGRRSGDGRWGGRDGVM